MLHYTTIDTPTLQLLKDLQSIEYLKDFTLVRGTSLALQLGHRTSIDIDLFTSTDIDIAQIPNQLGQFRQIRIANQSSQILNLFIDDIKVDFVAYRYNLLYPPLLQDNIKYASIQDIAAMKLAAITGRGSRKDFIDLYFILERYSLPKIFDFYMQKYPDGSEFLAVKSLLYFDDAETEPMPKMLIHVDWAEIKNNISSEVKAHFR